MRPGKGENATSMLPRLTCLPAAFFWRAKEAKPFADKPCSVKWNAKLRLPGGRPWRWPVNEGAKAVKKEKLFERRPT
jgi:hypothetical protein